VFLKTLEIFGFKSFPERTRVEFPQGITALIGPNGCGKSNIVDSIKWVLGEQSSKTLRASRMDDVIFNGTETRKPLNIAEVTLTLSNQKGILPLDLPEVCVKRRLFRTGESEYYINNNLVKLRDVRELFYDTGIGKSAYSIMEQGKIDQILSTKPEERRYIFEEAAGITKYKMRGKEAELKLIKTDENIRQVDGILLEVKRSHDTLKVQASKTEKYRSLRDEIFNLEVDVRLLQLKYLMEDRDNREKNLVKEINSKQTFQSEIDNINESMEKSIDLVNNMESKLIDNQKKLYGIELEKNSKESQIKIFKERIEEHERKIEYDRARVKASEEKLRELTDEKGKKGLLFEELEKQISEIEKNIEGFSHDIVLFLERIKTNEEEITLHDNEIKGIEKDIDALNIELRKITDDIVTQLDQKLKETGYSHHERKRLEDSIGEIIDTIRIQVSGKSAILGDANAFKELSPQDLDKILTASNELFLTLKDKIEQLKELFDYYKKSTPSFIDEFLLPEGIITKKRGIDQTLLQKQEEILQKRTRNEDLKTDNKNLVAKIDEYRKTLEELNINKARMQAQKSGVESETKRILRDIIDQEKLLEQNRKEIEETTAILADVRQKITDLEKQIADMNLNEMSLKTELGQLEDSIKEKNSTLHTNEKVLKEKMNILLDLQTKIEKTKIGITELNVEIKNVYTNFREQYSRDLADFEARMHEINTPIKELKSTIVQLKEELKKCGQVNLMAPEEYQEIKERYEFLLNQIEDLKKAKLDLLRITEEIRKESAELFINTYNQIRKNFHIMFRRLFGGGRAELKLQDPAEVLESGIEILAQPPGKNLESIDLLSGGERSMTGVALLFATYLVKPSPFCILDEIDAALDEENVIRFTSLLKEFSENSQFIVITHNKRTISGTEAIFGITMEESGVSKIISVRLKGGKEEQKEESYV
jgi:chromosome segregation protein